MRVRDSPAWSDALDEDDAQTVGQFICETHRPINKGCTLLPSQTEYESWIITVNAEKRNYSHYLCGNEDDFPILQNSILR